MDSIFIYGLTGDDGLIRYVGKTCRPEHRLREHKCSPNITHKRNLHKINWINKIFKGGEDLHMVILEECDSKSWKEREIFWVSQFDNLTNKTEGGDGGSGIKYLNTYEQTKKWVNENLSEIKSEGQWRKYVKNNNLPKDIPNRPDNRYKDDGWISWTHFFNNEKEFLSFNEVKKFVRENKINSSKDYREVRKQNMPYQPSKIYGDKWISWYDFLGKEKPIRIKKEKKSFRTLEEAKEIIKPFLFTKKKEYTKWYLNNKNLGLPRNPPTFYSEWVSWQDFFGNSIPVEIDYVGKKKSTHFLSYNETKKWVDNNLDVSSEYQWRKLTRYLPEFIPKRPDYVFKENGWVSWPNFFTKPSHRTGDKTSN